MLRLTLDLLKRLPRSGDPKHKARLGAELRGLLETANEHWLPEEVANGAEAFEQLWNEADPMGRASFDEALLGLADGWRGALPAPAAVTALTGLIAVAHQLSPPLSEPLCRLLLQIPLERVVAFVAQAKPFGGATVPSAWIAHGYAELALVHGSDKGIDFGAVLRRLTGLSECPAATRFELGMRWLGAAVRRNAARVVKDGAEPLLALGLSLPEEELDGALRWWDGEVTTLEMRPRREAFSALQEAWFFAGGPLAMSPKSHERLDRLARSLDKLCDSTPLMDAAFSCIISALRDARPALQEPQVDPLLLFDYLRHGEGGELDLPEAGDLIQWANQALGHFVDEPSISLTARYEHAPTLGV